MKIELSNSRHVLFFVVGLPFLSVCLSRTFFSIFEEIPYWMETLTPLAAYGLLYMLFDRYLWHYGVFRTLGIVDGFDLRGRWRGTQLSSYKEKGKNVEVEVAFEVKQTFSRIFIKAFYAKSSSESVVADFYNLNGETYLFFTYDNDPNSLKHGSMQKHRGTVKLKLLPNKKELKGLYFNDIGNTGDVELQFETHDLQGKL